MGLLTGIKRIDTYTCVYLIYVQIKLCIQIKITCISIHYIKYIITYVRNIKLYAKHTVSTDVSYMLYFSKQFL